MDHLLNQYTAEEMLQIDFPQIRKIVTKAELLNYLLKRFVHSNLKQARIFHFKKENLTQKLQYYKDKGENYEQPDDFDILMKQKTLKEIEARHQNGKNSLEINLITN